MQSITKVFSLLLLCNKFFATIRVEFLLFSNNIAPILLKPSLAVSQGLSVSSCLPQVLFNLQFQSSCHVFCFAAFHFHISKSLSFTTAK